VKCLKHSSIGLNMLRLWLGSAVPYDFYAMFSQYKWPKSTTNLVATLTNCITVKYIIVRTSNLAINLTRVNCSSTDRSVIFPVLHYETSTFSSLARLCQLARPQTEIYITATTINTGTWNYGNTQTNRSSYGTCKNTVHSTLNS
jgi:hypothetical protein